jgi:hypothetical protein
MHGGSLTDQRRWLHDLARNASCWTIFAHVRPLCIYARTTLRSPTLYSHRFQPGIGVLFWMYITLPWKPRDSDHTHIQAFLSLGHIRYGTTTKLSSQLWWQPFLWVTHSLCTTSLCRYIWQAVVVSSISFAFATTATAPCTPSYLRLGVLMPPFTIHFHRENQRDHEHHRLLSELGCHPALHTIYSFAWAWIWCISRRELTQTRADWRSPGLLCLTLIRAIQSWRSANSHLYTVLVKHNIFYYVCGLCESMFLGHFSCSSNNDSHSTSFLGCERPHVAAPPCAWTQIHLSLSN